MKVTYTTKNNRLTAEIDGDSPRDVFGEIAKFQEVFLKQYSLCLVQLNMMVIQTRL